MREPEEEPSDSEKPDPKAQASIESDDPAESEVVSSAARQQALAGLAHDLEPDEAGLDPRAHLLDAPDPGLDPEAHRLDLENDGTGLHDLDPPDSGALDLDEDPRSFRLDPEDQVEDPSLDRAEASPAAHDLGSHVLDRPDEEGVSGSSPFASLGGNEEGSLGGSEEAEEFGSRRGDQTVSLESIEAVTEAEAKALESMDALAMPDRAASTSSKPATSATEDGPEESTPSDDGESDSGDGDDSQEAVISVLMVEEDQLSADRLFEVLRDATPTRFEVTHVMDVDQALEKLQEGPYDVLLIDLSIQEGYGLESLYRARVAAATVPIVVLTYQSDINLALKATRAGAQDYLIKGEVTPALITRSLAHAVERHGMLKDLREAQQRQWFLANHDPLTSLQNRAALLNAARATIENAARRNGRLAFLFIDLDGFKPVNDNLGHAIGDEMLADVAGRLRRIRPRRDLVARLGGDEFVVVAVDPADDEAPVRIAEEIRDEIEKPYHVGGVECFISASIGVATYPEDGTDADELIRRADTAMYASKAAGRNAVTTFESEMDEKTQERFALVNSLREAIRAGDLLIEFQPQIEIATERVVGAETLVRWRHPTRGVVAPSEFIGVAEDTGMMNPLGEWVLRTACSAAAQWTELDGIRLAVNISGRQLEQRDFCTRLQSILEESGLRPGRLELELTETLAAKDSTLKALAGLRDLGVRIAIDDFGTGYSSFTLLKRLPADLLKIDQSFVRDALTQDSGVVILDAILRMARGLGMEVIAEGVETVEEMDLLLSLECHLMQGYLLGKPVPKGDFEGMMVAPDAAWRLPIERPEAWNPPSREELRNNSAPSPDPEPDSLGEESFPAIKF